MAERGSRLAGKVVVVTGGSTGLGEAMARACAVEGASVAITARGAEAGERAAQAMRDEGGDVRFLSHDVQSEDGWGTVLEAVLARWGRIDGLVNNAGRGAARPLADLSMEEFVALNQLNLGGTFLGMKLGARAMGKAGGVIINMGSLASFRAFPGGAAYAASKGGVLGLARARRGTARPLHVRVHTLIPGRFMTDIMRKGAPPEVREAQAAAHPMRRFGRPEELGEPTVFLLSDAARQLDGIELVIDGGQTLA